MFYRQSLGLPVGTAGATEQRAGEPVLGLIPEASLGVRIVQGWHRVPQTVPPHMACEGCQLAAYWAAQVTFSPGQLPLV